MPEAYTATTNAAFLATLPEFEAKLKAALDRVPGLLSKRIGRKALLAHYQDLHTKVCGGHFTTFSDYQAVETQHVVTCSSSANHQTYGSFAEVLTLISAFLGAIYAFSYLIPALQLLIKVLGFVFGD